ncbi:hypothetical protein PG993_007985 [Apiospora rasikravindrae]|uniref:Uncharacterized protein n=1 Tax=Apiospora rasikravindrae TaxID=990691 RepID=A0ABR1T0X1_9PEZI
METRLLPIVCIHPIPHSRLDVLLDEAFTGGATFARSVTRELVIVGERVDGTIPPLDRATFEPHVALSIPDAAQNHFSGARFFGVLDKYSETHDLITFVDQANGGLKTLVGTFQSAQKVFHALVHHNHSMADLRTSATKNWLWNIYGLPLSDNAYARETFPQVYWDEEGNVYIKNAKPEGYWKEEESEEGDVNAMDVDSERTSAENNHDTHAFDHHAGIGEATSEEKNH